MTSGERWLAAIWPHVLTYLPAAPARVVDVGCGPFGGFVPMLRSHGYDALGIDPVAPHEPHYQRIEFERADLPWQVEAVVASTSLHHVANPAEAIGRIAGTVKSGGVAVVIEWAWESFDERTAEWCFARLGPDAAPGWLHRRRDEWLGSGREWSTHLRDWAEREGLHRADALVGLLDERLERRLLTHGPYLFPELADTSEADEQRAIDADRIRATRIDYVGTSR